MRAARLEAAAVTSAAGGDRGGWAQVVDFWAMNRGTAKDGYLREVMSMHHSHDSIGKLIPVVRRPKQPESGRVGGQLGGQTGHTGAGQAAQAPSPAGRCPRTTAMMGRVLRGFRGPALIFGRSIMELQSLAAACRWET